MGGRENRMDAMGEMKVVVDGQEARRAVWPKVLGGVAMVLAAGLWMRAVGYLSSLGYTAVIENVWEGMNQAGLTERTPSWAGCWGVGMLLAKEGWPDAQWWSLLTPPAWGLVGVLGGCAGAACWAGRRAARGLVIAFAVAAAVVSVGELLLQYVTMGEIYRGFQGAAQYWLKFVSEHVVMATFSLLGPGVAVWWVMRPAIRRQMAAWPERGGGEGRPVWPLAVAFAGVVVFGIPLIKALVWGALLTDEPIWQRWVPTAVTAPGAALVIVGAVGLLGRRAWAARAYVGLSAMVGLSLVPTVVACWSHSESIGWRLLLTICLFRAFEIGLAVFALAWFCGARRRVEMAGWAGQDGPRKSAEI